MHQQHWTDHKISLYVCQSVSQWILGTLHILGTVEVRNFTCRLDTRWPKRNNAKIGQKGSWSGQIWHAVWPLAVQSKKMQN